MSRKIKREIRVDNTGGKVFKALVTPSTVKKWWGASQVIIVPDEGGTYALSWGDDIDKPEYVATAKIDSFKPNVELHLTDYTYLKGEEYLPFKAHFRVEFKVECYNNYCILVVTHSGFPKDKKADSFYNECIVGWDETLENLKELIEKDTVKIPGK